MEEVYCRICYSDKNPYNGESDLISPCNCKGSMKYIHGACLNRWRFRNSLFSITQSCEACKADYTKVASRACKLPILIITGLVVASSYVCIVGLCSSIFTLSSMFIDCENGLEYRDITAQHFANLHQPVSSQAYCEYSIPSIKDRELSTIYCISNNIYNFKCCIAHLTIFITASNLIVGGNIISVLNYVFTFWRLVNFELMIDKVLFTILTLYLVQGLYWTIYRRVEQLYLYTVD